MPPFVRPVALVALFLALVLATSGAAPAASPAASLSGVISAVDVDERTLTVKDPKAGAVVLLVPDDAEIVLDGDEQAVLEDLFEGDIVESATTRDLGQGKLALVRAVVSTAPEEDEPGDASGDAPPAEPAPPK